MVPCSTEESRKTKEYSFLALVQTLIMSTATWLVFVYTGFSYILVSALLIAPFLLLKTPKSIALSHKLFLYKIPIDENKIFSSRWAWLFIFLSGVFSFFLTTVLIPLLSFGVSYWLDFGLGALIGLVTGAVGVGVALIFFAIPLFIGAALGFLLRSIIVKFISTLIIFSRHPWYTLTYLPQNYTEQLLVYDLCTSPELLPDISKKDKNFSLFGIWKKNDWLSKYPLAPFWTLGYLYRFSIKSTAWFYWPFTLITKPPYSIMIPSVKLL